MLVDGLSYTFTFEWLGDLGEFFGAMFDGISEFSVTGLVLGALGVGVVYGLREWMLMPFLKYYPLSGQILWGGITYVGCFIAGYLMGKAFDNT